MKATLVIIVGMVIGFCLFWFGYGSAATVNAFGISDAIVGAFAGGLLAILATTTSSLISRDTQINSLRISHELEIKRELAERELDDARKAIEIIVKIRRLRIDFQVKIHQGTVPSAQEIDNQMDALESLINGAFPELYEAFTVFNSSIVTAQGLSMGQLTLKTEGTAVTAEQVTGDWKIPAAWEHKLQHYFVDRFKRGLDVAVPTEAIVLNHIQLSQAIAERDRE